MLITVHKVFITNVNNSADFNKVYSWLSKYIYISQVKTSLYSSVICINCY